MTDMASDVPPDVRGGMPQALPFQLYEEGEHFESPKISQRCSVGSITCTCWRSKVNEKRLHYEIVFFF